jgi:hypothetical protein
MSLNKRLEEFVRLPKAGGDTDQRMVDQGKPRRRVIEDVAVGYLHGRSVGVSNIITRTAEDASVPLGQHFHKNYGEVFALAHGSGELYVRAVIPGETNKIKPEIVVAQEIPQYFDRSLYGAHAQLEVDARDESKKFLRVEPGIAHTFFLKPGSVLVAYLIDVPNGFKPDDKENFTPFPLV